MHPTRQFWRTSALAVFLAGLAALVGQPVLLLGSGAVAALFFTRQWQFHRTCTAIDERLSVDVEVPQRYVRQGETTTVTLTAGLAEPVSVDLRVAVSTPLTAQNRDSPLELSLPAGETSATTTTQFDWPTAGVATFDPPAVTVRSGDGLLSQTFQRGPAPSLVVEPPTPRNIHVGEGGERIDTSFGAHRVGRFGSGVDPAELREYVPGDDVGDIDWKTTARQQTPYVLEYEVESDRRTALLFDHGASTATGRTGQQIATYLREVALTLALSAASAGDPLALYTVDDGGLTNEIVPDSGPEHYRSVRTTLHDIEPTGSTGENARPERARVSSSASVSWRGVAPDRVGMKADALRGERSDFATRLSPYLSERRQYVRRIEGEPLFDVARTYVGQLQGELQTFIFTDDSDPAQVHETVKVARGRNGHVVVFLAPHALFDKDSMTDLERTYERYREFESFRRTLARIDRVSAYEVAPAEYLDAILQAGRESLRR